jgi:hypothetical protein
MIPKCFLPSIPVPTNPISCHEVSINFGEFKQMIKKHSFFSVDTHMKVSPIRNAQWNICPSNIVAESIHDVSPGSPWHSLTRSDGFYAVSCVWIPEGSRVTGCTSGGEGSWQAYTGKFETNNWSFERKGQRDHFYFPIAVLFSAPSLFLNIGPGQKSNIKQSIGSERFGMFGDSATFPSSWSWKLFINCFLIRLCMHTHRAGA